MMLGSIWTKTLLGYWVAILCWGGGLGVSVLGICAYAQSLYVTAAGKAAVVAASTSAAFVSEPVAMTTPAGYITYKMMNFIPLMLGIWLVLSGSRLIRGEEERGALDVLLSVPRSRGRVYVEKILGLTLAVVAVGVIIMLCVLIGESLGKLPVDVGGAAIIGLNTVLGTMVYGLLAMVLGQVMWSAGSASGAAGGLMVLFYVIDGTARTTPSIAWIHYISPYFYYEISKPLIPTYGANPGALIVLAVLDVILFVTAYLLFIRRDIGGVALALSATGVEKPSRERAERSLSAAVRDWSLRSVIGRALRARMASSLWWVGSVALFSVWLVALTKSIQAPMQKIVTQTPTTVGIFKTSDLNNSADFISLVIFTFMPLALVFFALLIAGTWASDLDAGRMEMIASTPQARARVLLETYLAAVVWSIVLPAVILVGVVIGSVSTGISLDMWRVTQACLALIPLELLVAAAVYAVTLGLRSGITQGIVGGILVIMFLLDLLKDVLKIPNWLDDLSLFHQYGTPMLSGLNWLSAGIMTLLAVALVAVSARVFSSGDLRMSD